MAGMPEPSEMTAHDEDPEAFMGAEILDPWGDNTQLDWPNNVLEEEDEV